MRFVESSQKGPILIRADSEGAVLIWQVPDVPADKLKQLRQQPNPEPLGKICYLNRIRSIVN